MRMDAGMDTGDIAMQRRTTIQVDDTVESLSARLAALGAEAIVEALRQLQAGTLETTPQDHAQATVAPMLTKADGRLRFDGAACDLCCRARGVDPWPGAHARLGDGDDAPMVKLFAPRPVAPDAEGGGEPGEIMGLDDHGLVIACGEDRVSFAEVQLPGRKRLPAQAVLAGQKIKIGDKLT